LLVAFVWQLSAEHAKSALDARNYAKQYEAGAPSRIERACRGRQDSALIECIAEQVKAARENQRAEYDLGAQNQMADWAFWMMIVSTVTMVIAATALWYVKDTLSETRAMTREAEAGTQAARLAAEAGRAANEISERMGHIQMRAYLTIPMPTFTFEDAQILFALTVRNAGQSPARNIKLTAQMVMLEGGKLILELPQRWFFPGDLGSRDEHTFNAARDWLVPEDERTKLRDGSAEVHLSGKVTYNDVFGKPDELEYYFCRRVSCVGNGPFRMEPLPKLFQYVPSKEQAENPDEEAPGNLA